MIQLLSDKEESIKSYPDSVFSADVEVAELMGAETYLYLSKLKYNFTARVNGSSKSKSGDKVTIAILTQNIHLFDKESQLTIF